MSKPKSKSPKITFHNSKSGQSGPAKPPLSGKKRTVLAIGDMHHPFAHPDTLAFLKAVYKSEKCDTVVCMGDEIDAHSYSHYPNEPDADGPSTELAKAIEQLIPFYKEFPEVLVCESNHTVRPWKKARLAGLPKAFLREVETVLNAPDGWKWARNHTIDGVLYTHGDNGKSGQYAHIHYMRQTKRSVVIGHIHGYAGVNYEGHNFAMNVGCLIHEEAYAFRYASGLLLPVNLGVGVVYEGKEARFFPMHLNSKGRWIGRVL